MAQGSFDVTVLGVPGLQRKLDRLTRQAQAKAIRPAVRASAKRAHQRVLANIGGLKLRIITGRLLAAFKAAKIRAAGGRGMIRIGVTWPTRAELGIPAEDPNFYPVAIEYGHVIRPRGAKPAGSAERALRRNFKISGGGFSVPAHPFLRPAIDEHRTAELAQLGRDIGAAIERLAAGGR